MPPPVTEPAPRWLDDIEMRAWRSFAECVSDLWNALEADLAPFDLTLGDYQVLVYLSEATDGTRKMRELASLLQLSPSGLTRRLDGLVHAGYVERRGSTADRRVMLAALTTAGRAKLGEIAPHHVASVRHHIIDRLSPTQLQIMGEIFTTIGAGLGHPCPPAAMGTAPADPVTDA